MELPIERWMPVVGFGEYYEVSSLGRIRNVKCRRGTKALKVLINHIGKKGYPVVTLVGDGARKLCKVHQLVAAAFLGPCPNGYMVNHKNGIKTDVRLANLEYITDQENREHAKRHGLMASGERHGSRTHPESRTIGERNPQAKLTESEVRAIKFGADPALFNVSISTIRDIRTGRTWKHVNV